MPIWCWINHCNFQNWLHILYLPHLPFGPSWIGSSVDSVMVWFLLNPFSWRVRASRSWQSNKLRGSLLVKRLSFSTNGKLCKVLISWVVRQQNTQKNMSGVNSGFLRFWKEMAWEIVKSGQYLMKINKSKFYKSDPSSEGASSIATAP